MTTTKQYHETEGDFSNSGVSDISCRQCKGSQVKYQEWDSSDGAYTDFKYTCMNCGASWWIDGCDA